MAALTPDDIMRIQYEHMQQRREYQNRRNFYAPSLSGEFTMEDTPFLQNEGLLVEQQKKKTSQFIPGMSITEFVEKEIERETEVERLKWLHTFKNCVLPKEVKETIEEAMAIVLMSNKFDEWGINDFFEKGLTNSILIYGPPGTGKTMIAESFAAVLNKNLLKITSAVIQSQIPGQAERNIQENFKKAKENNAVLMFDECDSLLYNRNAVGMIMAAEINCLLTEIERFNGIVILTTNRLSRLDPALQRRIIAKVELGLPQEKERLQIWKNLIPPKMPIAEDIDFPLLSKVEISGGEIKNVILMAARKAIAQNSNIVKMSHFKFAIYSVYKAKKDFEEVQSKIVPHLGMGLHEEIQKEAS